MNRLNNVTLPATVEQPLYDRQALKTRIVHLGFGAFHRAHQALLTHRVLQRSVKQQSDNDWGICEVSLFGRGKLISQLRQQNHLYSVLEQGAQANHAIVIGAVRESLQASLDGITAIVEKMAEPQVAIISLTVTEKGYCMLPDGQGLDLNNPAIKADLAHPEQPISAPGTIVAALRLRFQRGLPPVTILSCDNIPKNGQVVKKAVLQLAQAIDASLAQWISSHVTFPSTMVDRIVPAATEQTLQQIASILGVNDPCGIICEPFIQWVIEDNFVAGRPAWDNAGAEFVQNVVPYEEMKLRMLNGSHSFLAYLGYLAGYQHINECMTNEHYRLAAYYLMINEQAPTLSVTGTNLTDYANRLIERYSNPALQHRTWQIAMDGTQKLPQRMLDSIRWHLEHHGHYDYLALGVAGWMRYVGAIDDAQQPIEVCDPMLADIQRCIAQSHDGAERVKALLSLTTVFGQSLPNQPQFIDTITHCYLSLQTIGAKATVAKLVTQGVL